MSGLPDEARRQRSLEDRVISGARSLRYQLTEPAQLRLARLRHARTYRRAETNPLVSVCVPTYNRADLLVERAVASVLNQTHTNLELIIVGHHCTDGTAEALVRIGDPRLRFFNMPRRKIRYNAAVVENHWFVGGAEPTNVAVGMARGRWIARIDDDDTWTPDHLAVLLDFAQRGDWEFVSASYEEERHGTRKVNNAANDDPRIGGVQTWLYRSYLQFFRYNLQCYRKSWNRVWDTDLRDRIYRAGVRTGFLDQVVAYVLPRPGEATVGLDAYRLDASEKLEHYKAMP